MSRTMKLSEIKISSVFAETTPSEEKMNECRNNYLTYHRQDRVIVVDHDGYLIDGYCMYIILKELGIEKAQIKISNRRKKRWFRKDTSSWEIPYYRNNPTTYIFGVHPNSKDTKTYMWRVQNNRRDSIYEEILPGDYVLCQTKNGIAPVIVTRMETLDKCPVDMRVKKFVGKVNTKRIYMSAECIPESDEANELLLKVKKRS